jgi:FkbM family methyltransferase
MAIRLPFPGKSIAQSLVPAVSQGLVWQGTDVVWSAANAFLSGIRGLGWSPRLEQEARIAASWVDSSTAEFVVIDAGANVGSWTTEFRKHSIGAGRIYAFEPQPEAAAKIRALQVKECEVLEMALGRQAGTLAFYSSCPTDTMGSLYERHDTYAAKRQQLRVDVKVVTLDDFVADRCIERIDFMKMDLEGAELEALAGADRCMTTGALRAFSFEFGISDVNSRVFFRDFFDLLSGRRYAIFRVTPAGRLIRVAEYSEDLEIFARTTAYFARRIDS